jgi:hypothetical protein
MHRKYTEITGRGQNTSDILGILRQYDLLKELPLVITAPVYYLK